MYRAVNEHVGRAVAIKALRAEHAQNSQIVERFLREARAAEPRPSPQRRRRPRHRQGRGRRPLHRAGAPRGRGPRALRQASRGQAARRGGVRLAASGSSMRSPRRTRGASCTATSSRRTSSSRRASRRQNAHAEAPRLRHLQGARPRSPAPPRSGRRRVRPRTWPRNRCKVHATRIPRSDVWALGVMMFELMAGAHALRHAGRTGALRGHRNEGCADAPRGERGRHAGDLAPRGAMPAEAAQRALSQRRRARPRPASRDGHPPASS